MVRENEMRRDVRRNVKARNVKRNNHLAANLILAGGFVAAAVLVGTICFNTFVKKSEKTVNNYKAVNATETASTATAATKAVTVSEDATSVSTTAATKVETTTQATAKTQSASQATAKSALDSAKVEKIVAAAKAQLGVKFTLGGNTPAVGFDSSGLVQYAYAEAGIAVTKSSSSLYDECKKISASEAQAGDLVFFSDTTDGSKTITNVGIYIGDNKMVSCSPTEVKVQDLTIGYFTEHLVGYGTIPALAD